MTEALTHKMLQFDLAKFLRETNDWLTFSEILVPGCNDGRVDVVAVRKSYAHRDYRAYEVKASRADFRRDVEKLKYENYLKVFRRLYFAAPAGILKVEDIPANAGLIVRGSTGQWRHIKQAPPGPGNLTVDAMLALLMRGQEQDRLGRDLRARLSFTEAGLIRDAKNFGHATRKRLARADLKEQKDLSRALARLQEVVERELDVKLDDADAVHLVGERLARVAAVARDLDLHSEAFYSIAAYLQDLRGWADSYRDPGKHVRELPVKLARKTIDK